MAVGAVTALVAALPAVASAAPPCPVYPLSQPFLTWGDTNEYTLLPGQSFDNLDGRGWQLSGGAQVVRTTLQDGETGHVLDMPAGSVAVTPPMCVNASDYPLARTMVNDVSGTQGIAAYVSYDANGPAGQPFAAGMIKSPTTGWYPSKPIMLHSDMLRGSHMVQLTLVADAGEYQLYNFFIDPRRSH